jgi:hypothetical protein
VGFYYWGASWLRRVWVADLGNEAILSMQRARKTQHF